MSLYACQGRAGSSLGAAVRAHPLPCLPGPLPSYAKIAYHLAAHSLALVRQADYKGSMPNQHTPNAGRGEYSPRISIRFSEDEHKQFLADVNRSGLNMGQYVRVKLGLDVAPVGADADAVLTCPKKSTSTAK